MTDNTATFKFKPNLKKRIYTTLLDYGLFFIVCYVYVMFFGQDNDEGGRTVEWFLFLPIPVVWFIYFVIIEAYYGATLAHQGFNLKVQSLQRRKIECGQALKRHLLYPLDILFYGIPAIISIKNSDKHQRIGDMWAKTFVVDITDPEQNFDKQTTVINDRKKTII